MVEAFAVASGKGGTGRTTTALAPGMALAESGRDVTLIDADAFRRAASRLEVRDVGTENIADRLRAAVVPEEV